VTAPVASTPTVDAPLTLVGTSGADTLVGQGGADTLKGLAGTDQLSGGAGDDILVGGQGRDYLAGDAGADRFVFEVVKDSAVGSNRDVVTFAQSEGDKIDLLAIDADTDGTAGNQAFSWIGSGAFTKVDGQLRFSGGILQGDTNGDGKADFEIKINGALAVTDLVL
jgi:Ca2+-binding RTX toxin-like protein